MSGCRCVSWIVLACFTADSLYSQTGTANPSATTFKAKVHVVVEDIVVTDRKGEPIHGLHSEDFQVLEDHKQQTITSFEEHKAISDQATLPPLPADVFTNFPKDKPADSIDVLLLDTLNTPLGDQSKMHLQVTSFLRSIPPGSHITIFTLSSDLHMVQGFTSDSAVLLAALNKKRPQASPLLGAQAVNNLDTAINDQLTTTGAGMPAGAVASMDRLEEFQNHAQATQDLQRTTLTLQALQQLANYLTGVPGRKNVIWFSDSFPLSVIPGQGVENSELPSAERLELRKTVNMLAAAQVAIYPISPQGLDQKFISDESRVKSVSKDNWRTVQNQQLAEVTSPAWDTDQVLQKQESRERARQDAHYAAMYQIARDTGGEAFYNTNDLEQGLAHAIRDGAHYYTISYSPTDKQADGKYRSIDIKLLKGDYHLAYRHGYFAEEARAETRDARPEERDPLQPLMISGLPDSTQIVYKIRVSPAPLLQPRSKKSDPGVKPHLKGPLTRYVIDFGVLLQDLTFGVTAEGQHTTRIEVALVAYDQDGIPVNSVVKSLDVSLNPQLYAAFAKTGLQLHEEIDVPNHGAYLRTGICDLATEKAGTLEVPLNQVAASVTGPK